MVVLARGEFNAVAVEVGWAVGAAAHPDPDRTIVASKLRQIRRGPMCGTGLVWHGNPVQQLPPGPP